ncbi:MAG: tetratricopeptide repeat protein [Betaproteobacteria bacterium]|nr:tetratricopeptide repeat protein [Betaproteobacteria bacterium]
MEDTGVRSIFEELARGDHLIAAQRARARLADHPTDGETWFMLGIAERALGDPRSAADCYRRSLVTHSAHADVWFNLGNALNDCDQPAAALDAFAGAVQRQPDHAAALRQVLRLAQALGRHELAEQAAGRLAGLDPDNVDALAARLKALVAGGRWAEAHAFFQQSLPKGLEHAGFLLEAGPVLEHFGEHRALAVLYERLDRLRPGSPLVKFHLGLNRLRIQQNGAGLAALREAESLGLSEPALLVNLGTALVRADRIEEGLGYLERAAPRFADDPSAFVYRFSLRQKLCDWRDYGTLASDLLEPALAERPPGSYPALPFPMTSYPGPIDEAQQLVIAKRFADHVSRGIAPYREHAWCGAHARVRIGYLSADFHDHATAHLMLGLFRRHDRSRFEVFAYSYGVDDRSAYRARIRADVEHFVDLAGTTDREAAARIHADQIDVLVDLKGYTREARTGILAHRPAPVQVAWLGYPGSMGAPFIDYALVDAVVVPPAQAKHYSERLLYMPHTYQINDDEQAIEENGPSREEAGLPEDAVVFCCFCAHYKIDPAVFDAWMQILAAVPKGVLWLISGYEAAHANLRAEAAARGIDPSRLVFAPREAKAKHLARHRLADLFLDTFAYNAHTTMSDALWAGLPAITCPGETFATRVGASLLGAAGLDELVAPDREAYVRLAIDLARDPDRRLALRERLATARHAAPLFDTAGFVRDWESRLLEIAAPNAVERDRRAEEEEILRAGIAAMEREETAVAIDHVEAALDAGCDRADAWNLYAVGLRREKRYELAELVYRRGLGLKPDFAQMIGNYANLLRERDQVEASLPLYRQAVALEPASRTAHSNLAAALSAFALPEEQLAALAYAEALEPEHPDAHWDKALALLMTGKVGAGLRQYEWRHRRRQPPPREYPEPQWRGEPLDGRRIFLHWEQGYGDVIQFARFIPLVVAAGGQVVLEVQPGLRSLVETIDGVVDVVEAPEVPPPFDVWASLLSVPSILGIDEETLPTARPYLAPPSDRVEHWRAALPRGTRPRIGLVWAGNPNVKNDRLRSPRLTPLRALLDIREIDWVLLQQGDGRNDLTGESFGSHVIDVGTRVTDFADTAAIMTGLDLVISSDTSTAHLAAALGCDTWVLLHYASDWRWGLGETSQWYPGVRLYRQHEFGDWNGVAERVRVALTERFGLPARAGLAQPRASVMPETESAIPPLLSEAFDLYRRGRHRLARMVVRSALTAGMNRADAWCLLGVAERGLKDSANAERAYRRAIQMFPAYADAWFNLGNVLRHERRLEEARDAYREAIRLQPANASAQSVLSDVCRELQSFDEAEAHARRALEIRPDYAEAWGHLGNALNDQERFEEAAACYERALQLPDCPPETLYNKGVALQRARHVDESIECYRTVIAARPQETNPHYNLATALLSLGEFEEGFREYESRLAKSELRERTYPKPAWRGEPVAGRRVLLYWEQGYGDTFQFLRFVPALAARGARVILELQAGIKSIAGRVPGVEAVFDAGEELPEFDLHAPLLSVPARLGLGPEAVPARMPYLTVPPEKRQRWQARLARDGGPLRVGVVWGGNPSVRNDRFRSPRLKALLPMFELPGVEWYVLQQGAGREDLAHHTLGDNVVDIAAEVGDFADTAAIMEQLDLVISSDTSTAHLAAALGRPTWVILHYSADWRWMADEGTLWYPAMRVFRQRAPGAWGEAVARMHAALSEVTATRQAATEVAA